MKKLIFIFIDGIGLGENNSRINPISRLFSNLLPIKTNLVSDSEKTTFDNGVFIPTDACLGIDGYPQSATGQTTIFTGVNASKKIGMHLPAFPDNVLADLIKEKSIMKILTENGVKSVSANLYTKEFFLERKKYKSNFFPASTLTVSASNSEFLFYNEYPDNNAVSADITNHLFRKKRNLNIDIINPENAAKNMHNLTQKNDFIFYEYFLTDVFGHKKDKLKLDECVNNLNLFVSSLWELIDRENTSILIVSDHGNAEDITVGNHTLNKVPTILFTKNKQYRDTFTKKIRSLTDIHNSIAAYFNISLS